MLKTMNTQPYTFGYARVSTEDQDLTPQIEALMRYGVPRNQIYADKSSGATMERTELAKVLSVLRPGDTLVIPQIDRLGRTISGLIEASETMRKHEINLVSLKENFDTTTAAGRMFFNMSASFAQFERDMISERTKAGMASRKANGVRFGKRHFIADFPKRLEWFEAAYEAGRIDRPGGLSAVAIIDAMNEADPDAPKIKSTETYYKWRRANWPGAVLREPPLDAE
jgi:DNA invertase Pin-like site-specific DNA recombinase